MKTIDNIKKEIERVFIIQPIESSDFKILHEEAISLIASAGGYYAGSIYQEIRVINPATYIGKGKLDELKELLNDLNDITILFNGELSPSQTLNISVALDNRKVIDRTTLILDIFAKNAVSAEGKIQFELSQLKYIYPRLKGKGVALSKLGGGIGTRGPGETQLESDRRLIRERIGFLEKRLEQTEKRRELQSERRKKNSIKTIALVGYTNTGKSTLMNLLTDANVFVKDELFATLDPTARRLFLNGVEFILVDTVGFLRNLPHGLIESFKSTLESAVHCDLALIVCDATEDYEIQLKTTLSTLGDIGFSSEYLIVMNKCEDVKNTELFPTGSICISAKEQLGIDQLKSAILKRFERDYLFKRIYIPYPKIDFYNRIKRYITETQLEYTNDGVYIDAVIPSDYYQFFRDFVFD